ncbi:MAG: bifunctional phosphoribosyl-AMP cyclohydrolase/phosphoribosyl-ATP diphosphatase HisIE, partial [Bacteroidales bacterium]
MKDINFDKNTGLIPAIIQDFETNKVLMLGYMNKEAIKKTVEEEYVFFYSRSKNRLWKKGETSGNFLKLKNMKLDCDKDTFLVQAIPVGPTCHKGTDTCWGEKNKKSKLNFLLELEDTIEDRKKNPTEESYTS